MAFDVKVETPAAFRAWLAAQVAPAATVGARGAAVFQATCAACHAIRGAGAAGRAGPDLTHVAARRSLAAGTLTMTRELVLVGAHQRPSGERLGVKTSRAADNVFPHLTRG
ncbi:c-type cytochrome [Sphingomonas phyllosphaerae]|uniref:c-type cytochrome n=1 Tax=Sphingomonas phyllosphaerae TaxID=257003 RepID=UPI00241319B9|nr:c-type cytochrome [Sphingomonas phyllosphaerae]